MKVETPLTVQQARNLHLAAQSLLRPPRARATRRRLLVAIEGMQLVQIDTIHVVARSPYFVLFSRLGTYPPQWLDNALAAGDIFECWAHEACFAPIADYALHRHGTNPRDHHWAYRRAQRVHREDRAKMDRLLAHVRDNGPVKSSDFEREEKVRRGGVAGREEKGWSRHGSRLRRTDDPVLREFPARLRSDRARVLQHRMQMPEALNQRSGGRRRQPRALGVTQALGSRLLPQRCASPTTIAAARRQRRTPR
jgi:hypothetical protein